MAKLIILICLLNAGFLLAEGKESFKLDEFLNGTFVNKGWNGTWVSDDQFIYEDDGNYYSYDVPTLGKSLYLDATVLKDYKNPTIYPSGDTKSVLIKHSVISIFRHSTTAKYSLYNPSTKTTKHIANGEQLQYCQWAGNTNGLIYVLKNDIFYLQKAEAPGVVRVTSDGLPGIKYNGVPDWVYEEEVLSSGEALWVSPNGESLVYAHFDDVAVPSFSYVQYGEPAAKTKKYPEVVNIRYPKVGEPNPKFDLYFCNLKSSPTSSRKLDILKAGQKSEDFVLYGVAWNVTDFSVLVMNRVQNAGVLRRCTVENRPCTDVKSYNETAGWLDVGLPVYSLNGTAMAQIDSVKGFAQLVIINGTVFKPVTPGNRVVTKIFGIVGNITYYGGSLESSFPQQHVFSYNNETSKEECLTCEFSTPEGKCQYATASFSKNMTHFAKICQGPGPNFVTIEKIGGNITNTIIWQGNELIRKQLSEKLMPLIQDVAIKEEGYSIAARLLLPPDMDKDKQYPMIVNVYGGPNSNQIKNAFSLGIENYLVTNKSYIYAYIDGRGSGRRGNEVLHTIYKKMGTVEIEDQIKATKHLQELFSYIDAERTCIWGWSYGGFATAWALVKDTKSVFKCGLSVAPVTNFLLYDSIYTERYMGLFEDNKIGYNNTDLTSHAEEFRGKPFFLIHGNADDNVHYQQSMLLARALELADVPFKQMSYPDENHSLRGVYPHLYHAIVSFWDENLQPPATRGGSVGIRSSAFLLIVSVLLVC